jgi:hypothetical protein
MRKNMREGKAAGQSQDEWRSFLPVTSLTSWTSRINFRDLVKLTKYFGYLVERLPIGAVGANGGVGNFHVSMRLLDTHEELLKLVDLFTNSRQATERAVRSYSMIKFLHEGEVVARPPKEQRDELGHFIKEPPDETDFLLIPLVGIPLWLRAQIVRHRGILFRDDFFIKVLTHPGALMTSIGEPLTMELAVTKEFWRTIMAKRSCWIAQDTLSTGKDPWQVIVDQHGWTPDMLPCADGKCPYALDAGLRLTPADPGAPCPRYLTINAIDQGPYLDRIIPALESRHEFWRSQVVDLGER